MSEYKPEIVEALKGHVSMETAYVVADYPYGFRLRCQIRYWLEFKQGKGFRFWSQTSNPKVAGLVWNKPKSSTYIENAAFMYLDSQGYVRWYGLGIYHDAAESQAFRDAYGEHINAEWLPVLERWTALKTAYEKIRDAKKVESAVETVTYEVNFGGGRLETLEVKK